MARRSRTRRLRWLTSVSVVVSLMVILSLAAFVHQRQQAELAYFRLKQEEAERQERWIPVCEEDFTTTHALHPNWEVNGKPEFTDQGLSMGVLSPLQALSWRGVVGQDQRVEIEFLADAAPGIGIAMDHHALIANMNLKLIRDDVKRYQNFSAYGLFQPESMHFDRPNTLLFTRRRNMLQVSLNGREIISYRDIEGVTGSLPGRLRIYRTTRLGDCTIRKLRVYKRQAPSYASILEVGLDRWQRGDRAGAHAWFVTQAKIQTKSEIHQEAQYFAARTAAKLAEQLTGLREVCSQRTHPFYARACQEAGRIEYARGNYEEAFALGCQASESDPQLLIPMEVKAAAKGLFLRLPPSERRAHLQRFARMGHGALMLPGISDISLDDLRGIPLNTLEINNTTTRDLTPLAGMSLHVLGLNNSDVHDIAALRGMPLRSLTLMNTDVRDLSPLQGMDIWVLRLDGCTSLDLSTLKKVRVRLLSLHGVPVGDGVSLGHARPVILRAKGCGITDLSFLRHQRLAELRLSKNKIADLSPLCDTKTGSLYLDSNRIKDLGPLCKTGAAIVNLSNNPITDLRPIEGMALKKLFLADTEVADLSPLAGMPLQVLNIANTRVSDLSALARLKQLEHLNLQGLRLTEEMFASLRQTKLKILKVPEDLACLELVTEIETLEYLWGIPRDHILQTAPALKLALKEGVAPKEELERTRRLAHREGEKAYLLLPMQMPWPEAERACRNLGGRLATPATREEANALERYLRRIVGPTQSCWLGRHSQPDSSVTPGERIPSWIDDLPASDRPLRIAQGATLLFRPKYHYLPKGNAKLEIARNPETKKALVVVEYR